jgi:O-antigen ligase
MLRGASAAGSRPVPAWIAALLAIALGLALGSVVAAAPLVLLLVVGAGAALAAVVAWLRWPQALPATFWLVFSLQHTVFYGMVVQGLYYPIYLLMAANVVLSLIYGRLRFDVRVVGPYLAFLLAVLAGVVAAPDLFDGDSLNRVFVYVFGFLVFFQFPVRSVPYALMGVQVVASSVIAGWVVLASIQGGFAYRGSIQVDQNYVSFLVGFGLVAALATLMTRDLRWPLRLAAWLAVGLGTYGLLLLASRGVFLAFAVAGVGMLARILLDPRRSVPILLGAVVAALLLLALPGSDALFQRLSEANLSTANDRLPLWIAAVDAYTAGSAREMLFGQGFEASKPIVRAVAPSLTSTHNAFLQMLVELGLVGLIAFVSIHATLLLRFWRSRSTAALYGTGVVVFMLMSGLSLNIPDNFVYWVAIGYLLALGVQVGREGQTASGPTGTST